MKRVIIATVAAIVASNAAYAEPKSAEEVAKACAAKGAMYKLSAPHKAGDVNPKTGQPYKRDSNGVCRLDMTKVKEAIANGKLN